jgi:putative DNA primase/helicase
MEYKLEGNPAKSFLLDYYEEGRGEVVSTEIYQEYKRWCEDFGFSSLNSSNFGKEIRRVFPNVERKQKKESGKRVRLYVGLVLKS